MIRPGYAERALKKNLKSWHLPHHGMYHRKKAGKIKELKQYGLLFTCMASQAIHQEPAIPWKQILSWMHREDLSVGIVPYVNYKLIKDWTILIPEKWTMWGPQWNGSRQDQIWSAEKELWLDRIQLQCSQGQSHYNIIYLFTVRLLFPL